MEKTKKKTIEHSGVRKGSPMEGVGYGVKDLRKRISFEFRVEKSRSYE